VRRLLLGTLDWQRLLHGCELVVPETVLRP
jgi:hypothetical protein